jgi:hypothetical protein
VRQAGDLHPRDEANACGNRRRLPQVAAIGGADTEGASVGAPPALLRLAISRSN